MHNAPGHRPVRVMHLLYELSVGGAEVGVVKVANGLDPERVTASICTFRRPDELRESVQAHVPVYELNRTGQGNDPGVVWSVARLLRQQRIDIVHTHGWATLLEGLAAATLARVPVKVHGEHGTIEARPRNLWIQRQAWRRFDAVLSVSSRLAETLAATVGFPVDRIVTIRNGVDTDRFTPVKRGLARERLGVPDGALLIGTVGRLLRVKDQHLLLLSLAQLKATGLPFRGVIVGDGPLRAELEERSRELGLVDDVLFLGQRADVDVLLAGFDIFVLSSESEGLSNVILEAMASGAPVVATRVGGADELVLEDATGLLVPRKDPVAMTAALERLACQPALRESFAARSRARAEQTFSVRRMMADYADFYVRIARHG